MINLAFKYDIFASENVYSKRSEKSSLEDAGFSCFTISFFVSLSSSKDGSLVSNIYCGSFCRNVFFYS
jgi:hypothetical protein